MKVVLSREEFSCGINARLPSSDANSNMITLCSSLIYMKMILFLINLNAVSVEMDYGLQLVPTGLHVFCQLIIVFKS